MRPSIRGEVSTQTRPSTWRSPRTLGSKATPVAPI
jgi:hypothetical protein